jgi:hypothetical protein
MEWFGIDADLVVFFVYRGSTLSISATGTLSEDVGEGAYVVLQVKYGLIRLVNTQADLCEQVANVDLECPVKKGKVSITKDVQLPKEIPPVCSFLSNIHRLGFGVLGFGFWVLGLGLGRSEWGMEWNGMDGSGLGLGGF